MLRSTACLWGEDNGARDDAQARDREPDPVLGTWCGDRPAPVPPIEKGPCDRIAYALLHVVGVRRCRLAFSHHGPCHGGAPVVRGVHQPVQRASAGQRPAAAASPPQCTLCHAR